ncbi:MAG: site-specific DNA-methyltransferase [Rhizobiaceae bacterium]|nr:site-specific DNA-methyltransferase [Rhizobiaceae bacterium]
MRPDTINLPAISNADRDPRQLKPWPNNARLHSRKQRRQLADLIQRYGFTNPVLIDEDDIILAGHSRMLAATDIGLSSIPCRIIAGLSAAEKRALVIADNKLALNATWDEAILAAEIHIVGEEAVVPVAILGFDPVEIDLLQGAVAPMEKDGVPEDDVLPPTEDDKPVSAVGDIWICGAHKVICGNALEHETYSSLMSGDLAEMVFGDLPYNVPVNGHVSGLGKVRHREFSMASGEMDEAAFIGFLKSIFELLVRHSVDGSIHFQCMDWRHISEITNAAKDVYSELKNLIVWDKGVAGMGTFYRSRHELVFVFKNGNARHISNFELGQFGRHRSNVWQYRGMAGAAGNRLAELQLHPTVKPAQMVADALLDCSRRGGIVLDPCAGSGSTLIAAEKTKRRARLIEIDPVYVDRTVRRWQLFGKEDAIHAVTGETFNQRAASIQASVPVSGGADE